MGTTVASLHHLKVGCGDASVIQTDVTFLVDCHRIDEHRSLLPASKVLRGVFITHQHRDHYSGLEFLRTNGYKVEYLIYSPYVRRNGDTSVTIEEWDEFLAHQGYFKKQGAKTYTPHRQTSWDKPWWSNGGVDFWLLGPKESTATSSTRHIHDACLVIKANMGSRKCLFTGDASDTNLRDVATLNHICDDILHASHHGSLEGADLDFVKKCKATYTVISTESGVHESVPHPTALQRYRDNTTEKVYRTDLDGSLKWTL